MLPAVGTDAAIDEAACGGQPPDECGEVDRVEAGAAAYPLDSPAPPKRVPVAMNTNPAERTLGTLPRPARRPIAPLPTVGQVDQLPRAELSAVACAMSALLATSRCACSRW
jgi:hypothetical protein